MIAPEVLLAFVAVSVGIILLPGPNVLFIVATTLAQGRRIGLLALFGTSSAMLIQLTLAGLGTSALAHVLAESFLWIKIIGALYLLYLGLSSLLAARNTAPTNAPSAPTPGQPFWRGFLVSLSNPKTILFFGAFLPQFVDPAAAAAPQLLSLSAIFFILAVLLDGCYLLAADRVAHWVRQRGMARLQHLFSGAFYLLAALGLSLVRRSNA